jgi:hypothetical protein
MNTPTPALLRKALTIVDEIEQLDRQIEHFLSSSNIPGRAVLSTRELLSEALPKKKKKREKVSQKTRVSLTPSAITADSSAISTPPEPQQLVPQQQQQALLIEDSGMEQLATIPPPIPQVLQVPPVQEMPEVQKVSEEVHEGVHEEFETSEEHSSFFV